MSTTKAPFTLSQLQQATKATAENAKLHYEPIVAALANFNITKKEVIASFLATVAPESQNLSKVKEDLYYKDAERLAGLFKRIFDLDDDGKISPEEIAYAQPYTKNSAALAQKLYDGYLGRAIGQVTWKGNYQRVGNMLGLDFVGHPELLEQPQEGAMASVALFVDFGMPAVAGDAKKSRRIWNGPKMLGVKEYDEYFKLAMQVLP